METVLRLGPIVEMIQSQCPDCKDTIWAREEILGPCAECQKKAVEKFLELETEAKEMSGIEHRRVG